jgi:hypothetical protein
MVYKGLDYISADRSLNYCYIKANCIRDNRNLTRAESDRAYLRLDVDGTFLGY